MVVSSSLMRLGRFMVIVVSIVVNWVSSVCVLLLVLVWNGLLFVLMIG